MASIRRIISAPLQEKAASKEVVRIASIVAAFSAIVRGFDYVTGNTSKVVDIVTVGTVINQFVNLEFWGWVFFIFGIELIAALIFRKHFFAFIGHGMLLAAYAMLMVSSCQAVFQLHDDFRAMVPPFGGILFHLWQVLRLKPWPKEVIAPLAVNRARGLPMDPESEEEREEYL